MWSYFRRDMSRLYSEREGQAGVFSALVMFTLYLFLALAFNIGTFVGERISVQTSADAVALSGAAWQARTLNVITAMNGCGNWVAAHLVCESAQSAHLNNLLAFHLEVLAASLGTVSLFPDLVTAAPNQVADYAAELNQFSVTNPQSTMAGIYAVQKFMIEWMLPLSIIPALRTGGLGGSGLNAVDITIPLVLPLPFMTLLIDYVKFPLYGNMDFFYPLQDQAASTVLHYCRLNDDEEVGNIRPFPDGFWSASICYKDFNNPNAPLLPGIFRKSSLISNGFLSIGQGSPFVPPHISQQFSGSQAVADMFGGNMSYLGQAQAPWDTKLMPITADNLLLSVLPAIGVILGAGADFLLLH